MGSSAKKRSNHRGLLLIAVLLCSATAMVEAEAGQPRLIRLGDDFPAAAMAFQGDEGDLAYLGLSGRGAFTLKEIDAELVLLEILNVHCVSCRRQAPIYNDLFDLIESDPDTLGKVKLLGVAAGNSRLEVEEFRQEYAVSFPIVADADFVLHDAIGGSRTPFTIFVRPRPGGREGLVVRTKLGVSYESARILEDIAALMTTDTASIERSGTGEGPLSVELEPLLTGGELGKRVKKAMAAGSGKVAEFRQVDLKGTPLVYTGVRKSGDETRRLFAGVVSRPSVCDVCHDVHFIYLFDSDGHIVDFVPLRLTKYGNAAWSEADVRWMRGRLVGRSISGAFPFDPAVDTVSSATITSAIIYNSLAKGRALYRSLVEKGLIEATTPVP